MTTGLRASTFEFQSTLPARGATTHTGINRFDFQFQSTLPARGATSVLRKTRHYRLDFNPRSPHGERHLAKREPLPKKKFQSTLPARGATGLAESVCTAISISIHAPRTGSDDDVETAAKQGIISIHAPRTGSDLTAIIQPVVSEEFQSTLPARGATSNGRCGK